MLLCVDIGNTNISLGLYRGDELVHDWRMRTDTRMTADELALGMRGMLGPLADQVTGVSALSTVPAVLRELRVMLGRYYGDVPRIVVQQGVRTGVPLLVDNPREVGGDRLVNTMAAHHLFGTACVVVDFGTSINYDVVSAQGEFLGGIIAPGVEISMEALHQRAAKLVRVDLEEPRGVIGKSTIDSVRSGVVYGFAGQVDGIVERVRDELGEGTRAIATGGLAEFIVPYCESIDETDDLLTLTGLRLLYERNAG